MPYEKYFFSGGSSSVRAWRPRRLGPGSFNPLTNDSIPAEGVPYYYDTKVEQPGEIVLEASVEFRSNIFGPFDWAWFLDFGNIWTFKEGSRLGSNFEFNRFYKEIAVGTGFGLRLNFNFLIIRLDYGMKVWDPGLPEGERFVFNNYNFLPSEFNLVGVKGQSIWNIAIGYPF